MTNMIDQIGDEQSRYCYPGTDILVNKKDIKNIDELEKEEKVLTAYKLAILNSGNYDGIEQTWDVKHYLSIHKFLFDELYDFAGKYRTENISKSIFFCDIRYISTSLNDLLKMMNYNVKKIQDKEWLVLFLSKFFVELNVIHPFREGNGRTLREFLREYVERINEINGLNYELDYKLMNDDLKKQYIEASIKSDDKLAYNVFDNIVKEKELKYEKGINM